MTKPTDQLTVYFNEIDRQLGILRSTLGRRYHDHDGVVGDILTEIDTFIEFSRNEIKKLDPVLTGNKPVNLTKGSKRRS